RIGEAHALRTRAVDVRAAHHFVLGAARPVLGVTFGAEGLGTGRPTLLADERFPGAGGCLADGRHRSLRLGGVPKLYRWRFSNPERSRKSLIELVGRDGFEPSTSGLKVRCSTD